MSSLISISTYKKWDACQVLLDSLIKYDYIRDNQIIVTDDNNNEPDKLGLTAAKVFKSYKKQIPNFTIIYGNRGGVARNKNRGIKYFLEKSQADRLILCDDDIEVLKPGLLDHLEAVSHSDNEKHITLKWYDADPDLKSDRISISLLGLKGRGWDKDFPVKGSTDNLSYFNGCQGIFLWFTRDLVKEIGYFPLMPRIYGAEHAVYSAQAMMAQGKSPELFPQLKKSYKWILGQNIANDYTVSQEEIAANLAQHDQLIYKIKSGEYLHSPYHGLDKKKERVLL